MALSDVDDLALAVGLVLFTLGILAALVIVILVAPVSPDRTMVVTGLIAALVAATSFFFKGKANAAE